MARMSIRIDLEADGRLGPGKVMLLERIAAEGSISGAARAAGMSYKRAWDLVAEMNASFAGAVVDARMGGSRGGGARLTDLGQRLVVHYRAIEVEAQAAVRTHLDALQAAARP